MWNAGGKPPACTRSRLRNGLPFSRSDAVTAYRRFSRIPLQSAARSSHADSFPPGEATGAAAPGDLKRGLPRRFAPRNDRNSGHFAQWAPPPTISTHGGRGTANPSSTLLKRQIENDAGSWVETASFIVMHLWLLPVSAARNTVCRRGRSPLPRYRRSACRRSDCPVPSGW